MFQDYFQPKKHVTDYKNEKWITSAQPSVYLPGNQSGSILIAIILLGVMLRVWLLLQNRSLWLDEAFLCVSVIERNISGLMNQLEYDQKAPFGFLVVQKTVVNLLGIQEIPLRLFPFLCGIVSLVLITRLSRFYMGAVGVIVSTALLAFSYPVIHHAVEAKQYSTELMATVVYYYVLTIFINRPIIKNALILAGTGAVLMWLSYPIIFIISGTGIGFLFLINQKVRQGDKTLIFLFLLVCVIWGISFLTNYFLFIRSGVQTEWLISWWNVRKFFMPFPPRNVNDTVWFFKTTYDLFRYPLGLNLLLVKSPILQFSYAGFVTLFIGLVFLARKQPLIFILIIGPVLVTLIASGLRLYPFNERLLVFLMPPLLLAIGIGMEIMLHSIGNFSKKGWLLLVIFLAVPLVNTLYILNNPEKFYKSSQFKEGIRVISEKAQEGEYVYLHWGSEPFFRYYKNLYPIKGKLVPGGSPSNSASNITEYLSDYKSEFDPFIGEKNVWLLINTGNVINSVYEKKTTLSEMNEKTEHEVISKILNSMGKLRWHYQGIQVAVYKYDFTIYEDRLH